MSRKPMKKSDENKEWLGRRKTKNIKSKLEYHLIICEGTQTEPNYFNQMKEKIVGSNKYRLDIQIVGKRRGTTTLLNEAIKTVQKSTNYISNVWLVYDKDDFTDESFETWILLHFIRFDNEMQRKDCIKKINENLKQNGLGKYQKTDENLYEKLNPFLNTAIENAKVLDDKNKDKLPSQANPGTKVYQLVEFLNKYM